MVGHPRESEEDFNELMEFVKEVKFERMGAFAYSEEEGTYSAIHYTDDISDEEKELRLSRLMHLQQKISADINSNKVGNQYKIIIDRLEGEYYIGRTEFDSPEVDGEVLISINEGDLEIGEFYSVKIVEADEFDLYGTIIKS